MSLRLGDSPGLASQRGAVAPTVTLIYTSLFARKAAATSEKKHQTHNNKNKQTKEKKNYAQTGRASEQCYHIYTPTNSKKTSVNQR